MNGLISVNEALGKLLLHAQAQPTASGETVPLASALGRITRQQIHSAHDVPPWDNSAMDGYALHSRDIPLATNSGLPVSQYITAGSAPEALQPGSCARIFTGAPMPEGADTVVMQENTQVDAQQKVRFSPAPVAGSNVRPQGQDIRQGSPLLAKGVRLRAQELGLLASVGIHEIEVSRPLRIAIASTGNELVEPGATLGAGQIFNSNRYTLIGLLQGLGQGIIDAGILPDEPDAIRTKLTTLAKQSDLIITSGGVSVGDADYLGQILRESNDVSLWKLAIKPGKPFTLGHIGGTPVMGLPGNPASALVTFLLLVKPWLLRRLGASLVEPLIVSVPVGFDWPKAGKRDEYLRAHLEAGQLQLAGNQSSGILSSASLANGLLLIPAGTTLQQGDSASFLPFSGLLG